MKPVKLKVSEFGLPIIYIARSSIYGGQAGNSCVFSTREEAIRWAKFEARGYIDWATWTAPQGDYPNETARDAEGFTPTFIATWTKEQGGRVEVEKTEVNGAFDWAAKPKGKADGPGR